MKFAISSLFALALATVLCVETVSAQDSTTVGANIPPAAADVVKLAQSGVGDSVVLPYIQNSQSAYNLTSDNLIYLRDIGLSSAVISAMENHDQTLANQTGQPALQPVAAATGNQPLSYQWSNGQPLTPVDEPATSTDAPDDVNYFYGDLSPYGAWVDLEGYGWCWQPTVVSVNPQWSPYCDAGHWVNSDAGWFWQSDYTWGWAPFHYGRWLRHERNGWVWFPDRVWGPAWVTWRVDNDNCGWAPLPLHTVFDGDSGFLFNGVRVGVNFDFGLPVDCFTFVGLGDFCAPDLAHHRLAESEAGTIYSRSTVITDYRRANQMVFNRGIPVERVAAVTHTTLRPIAIRDEPAGGGRVEGGGAPGSVVYRRVPQAPEKAIAVQAQKVDDRHPVIQHFAGAVAGNEPRPGPQSAPARTIEGQPARQQPERTVEAQPVGQQPARVGQDVIVSKQDLDEVEPKSGPGAEPSGPPAAQVPHTRTQRVADQAHALPPLFVPHDPPPPETPNDVNTHDTAPRSQRVAQQAHALPPLVEPPPKQELSRPSTATHPDAVTSPRGKQQQNPH